MNLMNSSNGSAIMSDRIVAIIVDVIGIVIIIISIIIVLGFTAVNCIGHLWLIVCVIY